MAPRHLRGTPPGPGPTPLGGTSPRPPRRHRPVDAKNWPVQARGSVSPGPQRRAIGAPRPVAALRRVCANADPAGRTRRASRPRRDPPGAHRSVRHRLRGHLRAVSRLGAAAVGCAAAGDTGRDRAGAVRGQRDDGNDGRRVSAAGTPDASARAAGAANPAEQPVGVKAHPEVDLPGADRPVRHHPRPVARRELPPPGHRAASRLAAAAARPPDGGDPGGPAVGAAVGRDPGPAAARRSPVHLPCRGLGRRTGTAASDPASRWSVPGRGPLRRARPDRPQQRGVGARSRRPACHHGGRLRRCRDRRRTGWTVRRRLRRLGRTTHDRHRPGVDRRPGQQQFADPQLSRLSRRHRWGRAVQPSPGPGLVLRRRNLCHAGCDRPSGRGRPSNRRARRRLGGHRTCSCPGHRRQLPAPGHPSRRSACRCRRLLRRRHHRGPGDDRPAGIRDRRRQLGRTGGHPPGEVRRPGRHGRPRRRPRRQHVGLPGEGHRGHREHRCPPAHQVIDATGHRPPRGTGPARRGIGADPHRPGLGPVRPHRRPAAHRLAPRRDSLRRQWVYPHRPGPTTAPARRAR